ncbi:MAG: hypothetical protein ACAI25_06385 [Planctomycetota bacterium]
MKPEIVFAAYRPKKGKEKELEALVSKHTPTLLDLELVTDRKPIVCRAKDGTVIEVFEWRSMDAARKAHELPAVAAIWEAMAVVADFAKLDSLDESHGEFPHFTPLDVRLA